MRGPQEEPTLAVDPRNPRVLLAAASPGLRYCGMAVYTSADGGRSWNRGLVPAPDFAAANAEPPPCAGNPWVTIDAAGRQYVTFPAGDPTAPSPDGHGILLNHLVVASRASTTSAWQYGRPSASLPATASDDRPTITGDTSARSPYRGRVYVAWSRRVGRPTSFGDLQTWVASSSDGGGTWSSPVMLGAGGWAVHLATAADGALYAAWWGGFHLEIARSTDGGATFTPPRAYASLFAYDGSDPQTLAAVPTGFGVHPDPALAVGGTSVYTASSRPMRLGRRIVVTVFDHGLTKQFSRRIAAPPASDGFDPSLAVDRSTGAAWLCFYQTGAGAGRKLAIYSCSISTDSGRTWSRPVAAASVPSNETLPQASSGGVDDEYGAYEGLAVVNGTAYAMWTDSRRLRSRLREEIYMARLRR
jgi:hypothetical protein